MKLSGLITTTIIVILGIWDLVAVLVNGVGSSVSQFLWKAGFTAPVMVFTFGFISGHLFGNMKPPGVLKTKARLFKDEIKLMWNKTTNNK